MKSKLKYSYFKITVSDASAFNGGKCLFCDSKLKDNVEHECGSDVEKRKLK